MYLLPLPEECLNERNIARFWLYVAKQAENDCWLWTGSRTGDNGMGYGKRTPTFRIGDEHYTATRIAYYIQTRIDPGQYNVCHNCAPKPDNYLCCNIKHLWLGTQSDNMKDCVLKGRATKAYGYKLTHEMVRNLRRRFEAGERVKDLADEFNIRREYLWKVVTYRVWQEIA